MNYSESIRIIKQAMRDNKLVIFVGAGASVKSGLPLWCDALKKIGNHLEGINIKEFDNLAIPQFYFNARGEKEYNELMKDIFMYDDKKPNEIHELIVKLNPFSVITTNYDNFIERTFVDKGEFLDVVKRDNDIPYVKTDRLIIKMHGGFDHNNFVLKEDDYLSYSNNFPLIETYVKALMAKNVILFIGYSYTDPDTRQIMSWVKRILGRDHQRAYLLEASKPHNPNNEDYYKNLGVNILYARECDENTLPCWECENGSEECGIFQNTINFLNKIIIDTDNSDIISAICDEFLPLNSFNYVMPRYITPILDKHAEVSTKPAYIMNNHMCIESPKQVELFNRFNTKGVKTEKNLSVLFDMFNKTNLCSVYTKVKHDGELFPKNEEIYKFPEGRTDDYFDAIDHHNLCELHKFADESNLFDTKLDTQCALRVAYAYYQMEDYIKCLHILKNLSSKFRNEKNMIWYFICEFNRKYVGKMFKVRYTNESLAEESVKIDLEQILVKIPKSAWRSVLNELLDFKLMYTTLSDVHRKSEKVEKDAKARYIGHSGISAIVEMEGVLIDLYLHLSRNFIMVDAYTEVIDIYTAFIDAVFYSHSKKEIIDDSGEFGHGRNIVLSELSPFMVMVICKYVGKKQIEEMIRKHSVKEIRLMSNAEGELFNIFENIGNTFDNELIGRRNLDKIWVLMQVLSYMNISKERFAQTLSIINKLVIRGFYLYEGWNYVHRFVVKHYNNNSDNVCTTSLHQIISSTIQMLHDKKEIPMIVHIESLLTNGCFIMSELDPSLLLDDKLVDGLITEPMYPLLISIYPSIGENMKDTISSAIREHLDLKFSPRIYQDAILAKVIDPSQDLEDMLFNSLLSVIESKRAKNNKGITSYPDEFELHLDNCIFLHLNDGLIDPSKFVSYFQNGNERVKFLYDMNNFDYDTFDLGWLKRFNPSLLQKISKNKVAYTHIRRIYKSALINEEYDEDMLKRFFEYFDS